MNKNLKKLISYILSGAMVLSVFSQTAVNNVKVSAQEDSIAIIENDFLKADGKILKTKEGKEIILRGVNAGGWLVQEPWMCPTKETDNIKCQRQIIDTLVSRFGQEQADSLIKAYEDNYWTESDFDNCAQMGMNVIRLPFTYMNILDKNNNIKENAFEKTDWFVSECGKRGMYVILDLHGAPGSQNAEVHSGDVSGIGLFEGNNVSENQRLTEYIWKAVAEHYSKNPVVAGYDLLNEPYSGSDNHYTSKTVWDLYDRLYKAIRKKDSEHIIIMEATWEPNQLPYPSDYGWENIMYEYHSYNYNSITNADDQLASINKKLDRIDRQNYNVPSYIGETSFFANTDSWYKCLNRLNEYGISWTLWSYKVMGTNNSWGLYNQNISRADIEYDTYNQIYQKWSRSGNSVKNTSIYNIVNEYIPKDTQDNGETIRYEAESADYISDGGKICTMTSNFGKFSNESYVEALNGNSSANMESAKYVSFKVNADKTGTYKMMVGYATTTDTKFGIKINGNDWKYRSVSSTGPWYKVWEASADIELQQGDNEIKISGAVDGDNTWIILDYFDLTLLEETTTKGDTTAIKETTGIVETTTVKETTGIVETTTEKGSFETSSVPVENVTDSNESTGIHTETTVDSEETTNGNVKPSDITRIIRPKKVKIKSIKNVRKRKAIIRVNRLKNVKGYEIKYSVNRKFKKKKIIRTKNARIIIRKLRYKKYYFRVRAYRVYGNKKIYGRWSGVKKLKIKK